MAFLRRRKFLLFLLLLICLLCAYIISLQNHLRHLDQFSDFNNETGAAGLIVPNIVHYVHLDQTQLDFVTFLCILSAFYNHGPAAIYLHTNVGDALRQNAYFAILEAIAGSKLRLMPLARPTHVFGQQLASVHHASDVARIQILMKYGGIYLGEEDKLYFLFIKKTCYTGSCFV
jgi:Glycosyltransferase sugar-binding region containing DXD motif